MKKCNLLGLVPLHLITCAGKSIGKQFAGRLGKTPFITGAFSGEYDAAAIYDSFGNSASDSPSLSNVTVLARTDWILNDPLVVRKDMDPKFKANLKNLLINMADFEGGKEVIEAFSRQRKFSGFTPEEKVQKATPPQ
ncbi:PhnD/SsuA/transferrin family substrate-binding protein [bacterium]|nr:PhnD/SsuA/transferrin family substrate-binding protein [bacterium]